MIPATREQLMEAFGDYRRFYNKKSKLQHIRSKYKLVPPYKKVNLEIKYIGM